MIPRDCSLGRRAARIAIALSIGSLATNLGGMSTAQADISRTSPRPVATQIAQFTEQKEISSLAFSPDATRLATTEWTGSEVHVWQLGDKKQIVQRFAIPEGSALFTLQSGLIYSPDGTLLAMVHTPDRRYNFGVVRVWDVHSGAVIQEITEGKRDGLHSSIGFSPNSRLLLRTYDSHRPDSGDQLFAYDTKAWGIQWSLSTLPAVATIMEVSPNGKWAAVGLSTAENHSHHSEMALVDLARHEIVRRIPTFVPGQDVELLQWSPDSRRLVALASVGYTGAVPSPIIDVNPETGEQRTLGSDTGGGMHSLVFAGNGKYLITAGDGIPIQIYDSKSMTLLQSIPIQPARLAVSRYGQFLAVARLQTVTVWKIE
jgi:WD40 repeat protein